MKIEPKTYRTPECQILRVTATAPILVGSDLTTTESITIDDEKFEW